MLNKTINIGFITKLLTLLPDKDNSVISLLTALLPCLPWQQRVQVETAYGCDCYYLHDIVHEGWNIIVQ